MQRHEMSLIDGILGTLQPVAIIMTRADMALAVLAREQIVVGQQGGGFGADVGKNKSGDFLRLIGRMLHALGESAVGGFSGLLQTLAAGVVKPTMVTAANASVFHPAEFQRCAAMRAMQRQQTELVVAVPKKHKIFAEQSGFGRLAVLSHKLGKTHRPPVAP